jgi:putative aldouronate transport system permease protein
MINSIWALVIPRAIAVWNLIVLRTFFQSIPEEMEESALLDGASGLKIIFSIILPLSKAGLAAIGLFYAVSHWNNFMDPLIYLSDAKKYPLQIIIRDVVLGRLIRSLIEEFREITLEERFIDHDAFSPIRYSEHFRHATLFLSIIPLLLVYPFLQKYFVRGVMVGALKE